MEISNLSDAEFKTLVIRMVKELSIKRIQSEINDTLTEIKDNLQGNNSRMGEDVRGLRSINGELQKSPGDIKYSIGSGVGKELIHMPHGHEQWWGIARVSAGCWVEWEKVEELGQL